MRTKTIVVQGESLAARFAQALVESGRWFQYDPRPDNDFAFVVKEEAEPASQDLLQRVLQPESRTLAAWWVFANRAQRDLVDYNPVHQLLYFLWHEWEIRAHSTVQTADGMRWTSMTEFLEFLGTKCNLRRYSRVAGGPCCGFYVIREDPKQVFDGAYEVHFEIKAGTGKNLPQMHVIQATLHRNGETIDVLKQPAARNG